MRIQHNTFSNAVQEATILSIRKSAACGKHAAGYRETNANELMIETVLSIRGGFGVASTNTAFDRGTTNLSIRSDLCVASTRVAMGNTPNVLSIRGDQCVASTPVALGETPEVLSIRSGFGVASAKTAMSYGS